MNQLAVLEQRHDALKAVKEHAPLAAALIETVRGVEVYDAETCAQVADVDKAVAEAAKKLKARKKAILDPLDKVVKEVKALFKPAEDQLDEARTMLKTKLNAYANQQLVIEAEMRSARLREAREAEERARRDAAELREQGADDTAEVVEVHAAATVALNTGPARVASVKGDASTFSVRKRWVGEVVDVTAFCRAVADGVVPLVCVEVNHAALNHHAKVLGEPMVAADPSAMSKLYTEHGFAIRLVAEGTTR